MSENKRTTVTTIETHEVWMIRKVAPEAPDGALARVPHEICPQPAIPQLAGNNTPNEGEETTK
ncbi:MAG TPA: hypothetical protein VFU37_20020 [Pyrinomonadaceae bacterium]|nr:hypothetical protein [Pyrinomonadaceae bacterium]